MRRGIVFAAGVLEPLMELSRAAERAGFDRVWTTEYPGRDAVARALAIAAATGRIGVGTGVAYAFTRAPLATAALAADVQRLSGGRFSLGLSAGTRGVRRWYDVEFEPPAPRIREYVSRLREIWADAETYPDTPPIYLPAFHAIMTRHAAAVADGLLLHPLSALEEHLHRRVLPAVARGAADRDTPVELVAWQITSIDDDEEAARRRAAAQIAFYLSTPSYAVAVEDTPWQPIPTRIRDAVAAAGGVHDWAALAAHVPEDLIDALAVAGRPDDVSRRMANVADRLAPLGVTELVLQTVGAGAHDDQVVEDSRRIIGSLRSDEETAER